MAASQDEKILESFPIQESVTKFSNSNIRAQLSILRDNFVDLIMPGLNLLPNVFMDLILNKVNLDEFDNEQFYKRADEANMVKKEKAAKNYEVSSEFKLLYKSDYKTIEVNNFNQVLSINSETKNIDWCLFSLKSAVIKDNMPSKLVNKQLKDLKASFKLEKFERMIKIVSLKSSIVSENSETSSQVQRSIESLKEKLIRLTTMYPNIKQLVQPPVKTYEGFNNNAFANKLPNKLSSFMRKQSLFEKINMQFFDQKKRSVLIHGPSGLGKTLLGKNYFSFLSDHPELDVQV
jgi:hypothetical protein